MMHPRIGYFQVLKHELSNHILYLFREKCTYVNEGVIPPKISDKDLKIVPDIIRKLARISAKKSLNGIDKKLYNLE